MVVKMMKWRPWQTIVPTFKYEAKIVVRCIRGFEETNDEEEKSKLRVELRWKGSKTNGFKSLKKKKGLKMDCTSAQELGPNGVVHWDEEFKAVCGFCESKDQEFKGGFLPWDVCFLVFSGAEKQSKKRPLTSPASLDLAEFACLEDAKCLDINVPLSILQPTFKCCPTLSISLSLMELKTTQDVSVEVQRPIMFAPLSPCFGGSLATKKDEGSTFKAGLRKVKSWTDYVSSRKTKSGEASSDSKFSTGSDSDYNYPFDTDSLEDSEEGESEESQEDVNVQNSCGYGTLVHANLAGGALDLKVNCDVDELVYYSNKQPGIDSLRVQESGTSVSEQDLSPTPKFGILAWRKRKLSFRSPKVKGEPLLKKEHREEGGDDIDFDRRQLSSDESVGFGGSVGGGSLISEFGDDNFAIGSWEEKEIFSRDGSMKLQTQVFFGSIDQRSERAAGESACTALVAVIADWLHSNLGEIPIKCEFDSLIREGSLQWRNLCENEDYRERFPDKHFDLETVLEAKIRPLIVVPEKSFIGFFHPEGLEEESFHFLRGAMSFDNIWDEICQAASKQNHNSEPLVYIISWNDHFFLLRVDWDAYYIIDTLGERLFEGCNQAYVLKFDRNTIIERVPVSTKDEKNANIKSPARKASSKKESLSNNKPLKEKLGSASPDKGSEVLGMDGSGDNEMEETVVCRGKESCKEYIKSFLAAIPLRELQVDMKKGLMSTTPLHHRLQIEFNYTAHLFPAPVEYIAPEIAAGIPLAADGQTSIVVDVAAPVMISADVQASNTVDVATPFTAIDIPVVVVPDVQVSVAADVAASMLAVAVA